MAVDPHLFHRLPALNSGASDLRGSADRRLLIAQAFEAGLGFAGDNLRVPDLTTTLAELQAFANRSGHASGPAVLHMAHRLHHIKAGGVLPTGSAAGLVQAPIHGVEKLARPAVAEAGEAFPLRIREGPDAFLSLPQLATLAVAVELNTLASLFSQLLQAQSLTSFHARNFLAHLEVAGIVVRGASTTANSVEGTCKLLPLLHHGCRDTCRAHIFGSLQHDRS
mmetsp:Transcript_79837/g.191601  ORF Transcript_79837/g.191601 Transcript_79837/m.191601 type:complete len:223 (-) Transcript_79837:591-1259(-)